MHIFKSDGVEIRYRVEGRGENVFMCWHGFGGSPADFQEALPTLTENATVIIPNLKYFLASQWPKTFKEQVQLLNAFTAQICDVHRPKRLNMIGQSYGATLSLAMRSDLPINVFRHIVFNPMPFNPLKWVQNFHIIDLLQALKSGADMVKYMGTDYGRKNLIEAARVFRIGSFGQHEIHHFNDRKLALVEKAMERFVWIEERENWGEWEQKLLTLPEQSIEQVFFSSDDSLFFPSDYGAFIKLIRPKSQRAIEHKGHMLFQDKWVEILGQINLAAKA